MWIYPVSTVSWRTALSSYDPRNARATITNQAPARAPSRYNRRFVLDLLLLPHEAPQRFLTPSFVADLFVSPFPFCNRRHKGLYGP